MKRSLSILICIVFLVGMLGLNPCAETDNLFITHLQSAEGVLMKVFGGQVEYNGRFDQNGALSTITDGNTSAFTNVYGALDWETPRYVGVLMTLDNTYFGERVVIYSGASDRKDTYRVYASDKLSNLYGESNRVADGLVVSQGAPETVKKKKNVRYIAFFCTGYVGNQRIKEVQFFGTERQEESPVGNTGVTTKGKQLLVDGTPVSLQGVNIPHFSWSSYGDGSTAYGQSDADTALNSIIGGVWNKSRSVRWAVDPVLYVRGGVGVGGGQTVSRSAEEYRALIDKFVNALTDRKIAVIVDCHAYAGVTDEIVAFWQVAAPHFDDNEYCISGLLNEPISD
ncbi:MAG: glycoside hydrolase family 5 protein, partial [Clostridia bacterium]|nr:glycoside hydrolase family 5 protein [Clostridia bacterium]